MYAFRQVIEIIRHPVDKPESKYNPDTSGISKEDEERYQKMVIDNEELQRLIAQVYISFKFVLLFLYFAFILDKERRKNPTAATESARAR